MHKSRHFFLIILLLMGFTSLFSSNKMDYQLRELMTGRMQKAAQNERVIDVVVQCNAEPTGFLTEFGVVRTTAGPYATMAVEVSKLEKLAADARITFVAAPKQMRPLNDRSVSVTGTLDAAQAGYSGDEVLIGIVDTGIDITHPGFQHENGQTRVRYLWDQTEIVSGRTVDIFDYGTEWNAADIDAGVCTQKDFEGHGTHVAGCAAQFFYDATDSQFNGGVKSNLIIVKTDMNGIHIVDGIQYIIRKAEALGKPVVINISLGSQYGPHDGTDPLTALTDFLTGPGKIIVRSAGNDGDNPIHDLVAADANGESMPFSLENAVTELSFDCWYAGDQQVAVEVVFPGGKTPAIASDLGQPAVIDAGSFTINIRNAPYGPEAFNSGKRLEITMSGNVPKGNWQLRFISPNSTPIHAWMYQTDAEAGFAFSNPDYRYTLANEACGENVIVVGATVSRNEFDAYNEAGGISHYLTNENLATVATFSSSGPTRDGRQKPDLAMPGSYLITAFSIDALSGGPALAGGTAFAEGPIYQYPYTNSVAAVAQGTSTSSPVAGGLMANLIDWFGSSFNRLPSPYDIKELVLKRHARPVWQMQDHLQKPVVASSEPVWDYRAGWGYLDLRDLLHTTMVTGICREQTPQQLLLEFSDIITGISNPADFSIHGASTTTVTAVQVNGTDVTLTLSSPLREGYRDTLLVSENIQINGVHTYPIQKPGTIVDFSALTHSSVWTPEASPYYVHQQLLIYDDVTLQLDPGTRVEFMPTSDNSAGFVVYGRLCAVGEYEKPICFTACGTKIRGCYDGLVFVNAAQASELVFCEIDYANEAVFIQQSDVSIRNCMIRHSRNMGIFTYEAAPLIESTVIWDTNGGSEPVCAIYLKNTVGTTTIRQLTIVDNEHIGIAIDNCQTVQIQTSIITDNYVGIYNYDASPVTVSDCDVWGNTGNYYQVTNRLNCISADPRFQDAANGDFHLRPDSPCLNLAGAFIGALPQTGVETPVTQMLTYQLLDNYPNPFNGGTKIEFQLPELSPAKLQIFNMLGQQVRLLLDTELAPGNHQVTWDGCDEKGNSLASGVYVYRLQTPEFTKTKRLMLLQ